MATTIIRDLPSSRALDLRALRSIRGGGAEWIFGAFRAFVREVDPILPIVNFNQTNNFFVADQLNVQFQNIDVENSAPNANINVVAGQKALNFNISAG
jgi:hypothetical protein